ncbi:MAG TPA: cysteine ABC transporter ATP-binding protein, partial [Clostridia bacterium]|nr:cysteine ABC transporter ATP-binding protein [Clostridia bacterium]
IFDEATSNIDIESEAIIMQNIKALSKDKCVIVISHRLANVVSADNIYFIANGEVKESGDNNTLLNNKQGYERLFSMQKELEEGYAL